ncbi:hypothetical protein D3C84_333750 [compost metagenome]
MLMRMLVKTTSLTPVLEGLLACFILAPKSNVGAAERLRWAAKRPRHSNVKEGPSTLIAAWRQLLQDLCIMAPDF